MTHGQQTIQASDSATGSRTDETDKGLGPKAQTSRSKRGSHKAGHNGGHPAHQQVGHKAGHKAGNVATVFHLR